jgi:hypothetical protein
LAVVDGGRFARASFRKASSFQTSNLRPCEGWGAIVSKRLRRGCLGTFATRDARPKSDFSKDWMKRRNLLFSNDLLQEYLY